MNEVSSKLKQDINILINELEYYGSRVKRSKSRSCVHCSSSDGLSIKESNNTYKCFSCGSGGDVINLVSNKENTDFIGAIKILADKYNIDIPKKNPINRALPNKAKQKEIQKQKIQDEEIKKIYIDRLEAEKMIKISNHNIPMEDVFSLMDYIKDIKANREPIPEIEYKQIKKELNLKKILKSNYTEDVFEINKYLSEHKDLIKELLNEKGLFLLNAPTGSGKTWILLELFKELSKINSDTVYVIACPNRIQNQQNGKKPGVFALVGGKQIEVYSRVISAVYEKVDELLEDFHDKKIVMVIDEAHQLLDSINYRYSAIEKLEKVSSKCDTVIHLTATDRKLLGYDKYNYDKILKFKAPNNYNLKELSVIKYENMEASLFSLLRINKANNKKSLVFVSGAKSNLDNLKNILEAKGLKVEVVTKDSKDNEVFMNIVEKSLIPDMYDVILASSVLDCGTNIDNKSDIVPIELITNIKHFNLDNTEQRFARLRQKQNIGFLLIPALDPPDENIKSLEEIKSLWNFKIKKLLDEVLNLRQFFINGGHDSEQIEETLNSNLKNNGICYGYGIIELVEGYPTINDKKLLNRIHQEYDKQFIYNSELLKEVLKERVKAENITMSFEIYDEEDAQAQNQLKEAKKESKEQKKIINEDARNKIIELSKGIYLEEYLLANDKKSYLDMVLITANEEIYKDIMFIEDEEKEIDKIKALMTIKELREDFRDSLMYVYINNPKKAQIDLFIKRYLYIEANTMVKYRLPIKLSSIYGAIRKVLDPVYLKQGRITDKLILTLTNHLEENNLLKKIVPSKVYKDFMNEDDPTKRKKILDLKVKPKLINEISLIYKLHEQELNSGNKVYKISGLIKELNI